MICKDTRAVASGGQWCPATPFKTRAPHFMFVPPLAAHIQCFMQKFAPLVVFGPPCCEILTTGLKNTRSSGNTLVENTRSGSTVVDMAYEHSCFVTIPQFCHKA